MEANASAHACVPVQRLKYTTCRFYTEPSAFIQLLATKRADTLEQTWNTLQYTNGMDRAHWRYHRTSACAEFLMQAVQNMNMNVMDGIG